MEKGKIGKPNQRFEMISIMKASGRAGLNSNFPGKVDDGIARDLHPFAFQHPF